MTSSDETIELAEKAAELFDEAYFRKVFASGMMVGAGLMLAIGTTGWIFASKRMKAKYEDIAAAEIAEAKEFYGQLHKAGDFATPEGTVEALGKTSTAAARVMRDYSGAAVEGEVVVKSEETEVEVTPVKNVFTEHRPVPEEWDQDEEDALRATLDNGVPFIISQEEYMEGELDYRQSTLSYFGEDDVLCDEQEKPIPAVDEVVGEENLTKFGHGSNDNRIVYIRNDKLSMDFEIVKNDGSYAETVAGYIRHEDRPKVMKFRPGDNG